MKKLSVAKIILISAIVLLLGLTAFACTEQQSDEVTVKFIEVTDAPTDPYIQGDPNVILSDVVLTVTYSDKQTEKITLSDDLISGEDRKKFQQVGTHTVEINYNGGVGYYNFEVVAITQQDEYLASFYARGGTEYKSIATATVTAFPSPEREGYTFDGWYADVVISDDGDIEEWGARAVEPYELSKNTAFYAKWIDNRVCTVKFYDYDNSVIYAEQIHYGEKIDVNSYVYPEDNTPEGRTFNGWNVTNGNPNEVTVDLIVKANFLVDKCIVKIVYANTAGETINVEHTFDYGTEFSVGEGTVYVKPEKEGHTSRFVMYVNHAEDTVIDGEEKPYQELPSDNTVILTEPYTTIMAEFTILTYDINVYNGKEEQTKANLKSGNIELEMTYENASTKRKFSVDWNAGFDFADYTQEPDIETPALLIDENGVSGYTGQWCYVTQDSTGAEIWYNGSGLIWNAEKQIFEDPPTRPEGETDTEWTLVNADGEYVAKVKGGKLIAIKNEVTVKALYTKKTYDVKLIRQENGAQKTLVTFKVKYLADFNIYNTSSYPNEPSVDGTQTVLFPAKDVTGYCFNDATIKNKALMDVYNPYLSGTDIEKLYLKENTDFSIKQQAIDGGYYVTSEIAEQSEEEEDWTVEWFTNVAFTDQVDFLSGETVEINGARNLYCKDTDNRKYEVLFFYGYDFFTDSYVNAGVNPNPGQEYYAQDEAITPPITSEDVNVTNNGVTLAYRFSGWYDVPYSLYLKTGYRGKAITSFTSRTSAVYHYAHYECTKTVTVQIFDKTQSTAYIGNVSKTLTDENFTFEDCSVFDNTVLYTLSVGTKFNLSKIYKGKNDGTSINTVSQVFYDGAMQNAFYEEEYLNVIKPLVESFGDNALQVISEIKAVIDALIADYNNALNSVYAHDYSYENEEYEYYLTVFDNASNGSLTTFVDLYNALKANGGNVTATLDKVGYSDSLMNKLGTIDDFISNYASLLYDLYNKDYTDNQTTMSGINHANTNTFSAYLDKMSVNAKLRTVSYILAEYAEITAEYQDFVYNATTPKYENSALDLNNAYDYNGTTEIKYSFSGWYLDAEYTRLYSADFNFPEFALFENVVLYAKWTDVTRGTEGLVYEEVQLSDGTFAYVLVDFTNEQEYYDESKGYTDADKKEFYYVTTNDTGAVPVQISGEIELQIPAEITKYLNKTDEATAQQSTWNSDYKYYLIYKNGAYVQASATFSSEETYYKKAEYPVIGIKQGALDTYAQNITRVTIPLNMYFLEDGAFRRCNTTMFSRTQPKDGETELSYVVVDATETAIYQQEKCPYTSVVGRASGISYDVSKENAIIAYAINNTNAEYTLMAGTTEIGDYAFENATYLETLRGTENLTRIGDYAVKNVGLLTTVGSVDSKFTIPTCLEYIGIESFNGCVKLTAVDVIDGAKLTTVGVDAFLRTNWADTQKGIIVLKFNDENSVETGIILGYNSISVSMFGDSDKCDEDGTLNTSGEYYRIDNNGIVIIWKGEESGKVQKVIVNFDVRSISDYALTKYGDIAKTEFNAINYEFKSIGYIGKHAFGGHVSLDTFVIHQAYNGTATVMGENVFYGRGNNVKVYFYSEEIKTVVTGDDSWGEQSVDYYIVG